MMLVSTLSPNFHTRPLMTKLLRSSIHHLPRARDPARYRRCRHGRRPGEVNFGIGAAFAAAVISRRASDADFPVHHVTEPGGTDAASRFDKLGAGADQRLDQTCLQALTVNNIGGRRNNQADTLGDFPATENS